MADNRTLYMSIVGDTKCKSLLDSSVLLGKLNPQFMAPFADIGYCLSHRVSMALSDCYNVLIVVLMITTPHADLCLSFD